MKFITVLGSIALLSANAQVLTRTNESALNNQSWGISDAAVPKKMSNRILLPTIPYSTRTTPLVVSPTSQSSSLTRSNTTVLVPSATVGMRPSSTLSKSSFTSGSHSPTDLPHPEPTKSKTRAISPLGTPLAKAAASIGLPGLDVFISQSILIGILFIFN
jgi:hypothetical protein